MVVGTTMSDLALGILCMVGSFCVTIAVLLPFLLFNQFMKRRLASERDLFIKKEKPKRMKKIIHKNLFHSKKNQMVLKENEDSRIGYLTMFQKETEKLGLEIRDITIGDRTNCIKPHLGYLNEIFLRILLNNNTTNSIMMSEMYNFNYKIIIGEKFLFSLKEFQLKNTVIIIEVFVTLVDNLSDLLLGWTEVTLPKETQQYPFHDSQILREVHRPLDLYVKPVGYACISLASLHDIIKIAIIACNFDEEWIYEETGNSVIYFNLEIKDETNSSFGYMCHTSQKVPTITIVWNEIFLFEIPNKWKENSVIDIELWKSIYKTEKISEEPKLIGNIKLGLNEECPQKSQQHWENILKNENKDISRWHPLRS